MLAPQQSRQFDELEGSTLLEGRIILQKRLYRAQKSGRAVYQGLDHLTEKMVAVKVFQRSMMSEKDAKLFIYEMEVMQKIRSPHVIKYVAHQDIKTQSKLFIVMEYVNGLDLLKHLNKFKQPFSEEQALTYLIQIFKGLYELHKEGYAHRDLKLENIMLEDGKIMLIDFGFSKRMLGGAQGYLTQTMVGTQIYIAPEILLLKKYNPFISDIYSLGVILFTMTQLKYPYDPPANMSKESDKHLAELIRLQRPEFKYAVSQGFKELVFKMMEYDPQNRITHSQILQNPLLKDLLTVGSLRCDGSVHVPDQLQLQEYYQFYVELEKRHEAKTDEEYIQIINKSLPLAQYALANQALEEEEQRADLNTQILAEKKSLEILEMCQKIQEIMKEYEHNLNVLIWLTKVFFLYQSNQPRFQQQVLVAVLLFKIIIAEYQKYKQQLENDENLFNFDVSLFNRLINHEDYQKHKVQFFRDYYPIIQSHIQVLLPEFSQVISQQNLEILEVEDVSQIQNLLTQKTQQLLGIFTQFLQRQDQTEDLKQYIVNNIRYYSTVINPRQYFKVLREGGNFDFHKFQKDVDKRIEYSPQIVKTILSQTNRSVVSQLDK